MFDFATEMPAAASLHLPDVACALTAGTKVATHMGWRVIEAVAAGDLVLTFDGGLQTVTAVSHHKVCTASSGNDYTSWPLTVPAGALGNHAEMTLLPRQAVLVESDTAEAVFGDPFAMIPAAALDGFRGIHRRVPAAQIQVVTLHFAQDEVVFANIGALFHCPTATDLLHTPTDSHYHMLSATQADLLIRYLACEDGGQTAPDTARHALLTAA